MVMVHTFLALLAGFATTAALIAALTAAFTRLAPEWVGMQSHPQPGYVFVNLGGSFLAAAAGGYVTAWAGSANPLYLDLALAVAILALTALSIMQSRGKQPVWYQLALIAIAPVGVFAGGLLRMRILGIL